MNDSQEPQGGDRGPNEQVRVQHLSARVPERISRGAFSTGVIVMTGGNEFVIDFIQSVGQPAQVAARVVMPHAALPQFIEALRKNLDLYAQRFGPPPELPRPQQPRRQPTAQEIYDELKLPDDLLSGVYANGVMIGHTASEFRFDFLTNLFPHSAVSARVFLATPQVPRMLESLEKNHQQFQQRLRERREGQGPAEPGPEPEDEPPSDEE